MDCRSVKQNISAFIDGKLAGRDLSAFKEHLARCADCSRILAETSSAISAVKELPGHDLPHGFMQRLGRKLDGQGASGKWVLFPFNFNVVMKGAIAAAAVVLAVGVVREIGKKPVEITSVEQSRSSVDEIVEREEEPLFFSGAETSKRPAEKKERYPEKLGKIRALVPRDRDLPVRAKLKSNAMLEHIRLPASPAGGEDERLSSVRERDRMKYKSAARVVATPAHGAGEWQGPVTGIAGAITTVFRDKPSWERFWMQHTGQQSSSSKVPAIDFTRQMVVAVVLEQKMTGGYMVEITGIKKRSNSLLIQYTVHEPPKGAMVAQMLTRPYHIKVIERSDLPAVFQKIE